MSQKLQLFVTPLGSLQSSVGIENKNNSIILGGNIFEINFTVGPRKIMKKNLDFWFELLAL